MSCFVFFRVDESIKKVAINECTKEGFTALWLAIDRNLLEPCKVLLENKAGDIVGGRTRSDSVVLISIENDELYHLKLYELSVLAIIEVINPLL